MFLCTSKLSRTPGSFLAAINVLVTLPKIKEIPSVVFACIIQDLTLCKFLTIVIVITMNKGAGEFLEIYVGYRRKDHSIFSNLISFLPLRTWWEHWSASEPKQ